MTTPEHDIILQAFRACGAEHGMVWILAAETTGKRELDLMLELDATRDELRDHHPGKRWERVIQPNARAAQEVVDQARQRWPQLLAANLNGLDVPAWERRADLHTLLKDTLFDRHARVVVAGPDWAFSTGERRRANAAIARGLDVVDDEGRPVDAELLHRQAEAADRIIRGHLAPHPRLCATIPDVVPDVPIALAP